MSKLYPVSADFAANARIDKASYERLYAESVADPEEFWRRVGKRLDWIKPYSKVKDVSFDADDLHIRWYHDGELNVSANCLDRHLAKHGDKTAIIWEGDDPAESRRISYRELHADVSRCANLLKNLGVAKGDRVCIYLPMIPEAAIAMLACTRIGAVHSIVFGGFSPDSLAGRIAKASYLGKHLEYSIETPIGSLFVVDRVRARPLVAGNDAWITFAENGAIVVPA